MVYLLLSIFALFRERIKYKIRIPVYTTIVMTIFIFGMFLAPRGTIAESDLQMYNEVGLSGVLLILYAIRPNYGPEANKRIYQAVAGILCFVVGVLMLCVGVFFTMIAAMAFSALVFAVAYLLMTGQGIALPQAASGPASAPYNPAIS